MEFVFLVGAASGTVAIMTAQDWIGPENDLSVPGICLAKAQAPESPQGFGVPKIPLDLSKPNQLNSVDLMQADVPGHAIEVAPGGLNAPPVSVKVHVVNGGAATLPVSAFFARSNAIAIPHEVPPGGGG